MSLASRLPLPWALLASVAVHALVVGAWSARSSATPTRVAPPPVKDAWAASSVEVGTIVSDPTEQPTAPTPPAPTPLAPREQTEPLVPGNAPTTPSEAGAEPSLKPAKRAKPAEPTKAAAVPSVASPQSPSPSASKTLASAASDSAQPSSPGSLGTLGLPPGVRHLVKAFARALPEGGHRDPSWSELPLGPVGRAVLTIHVDAEGHIERAEFDPEIPAPAPLKRMIERTLLLLKTGTFSLDKKRVSAGRERLSLDVTLTREATDADEMGAPHLMAKEGHQAPEPERAGYARFTLNSGLHMEAVLKLLKP